MKVYEGLVFDLVDKNLKHINKEVLSSLYGIN